MDPESKPPAVSSLSWDPPRGSSQVDQPSAIPPWVQFILDDMNRQFGLTNTKIDKLVTQVEFRDEKSRVSDALRELSKDVAKNASDIQAESTARANSEIARTARERDVGETARQTERQTRWQWVAIPLAVVAGYLGDFLLKGGLTQ